MPFRSGSHRLPGDAVARVGPELAPWPQKRGKNERDGLSKMRSSRFLDFLEAQHPDLRLSKPKRGGRDDGGIECDASWHGRGEAPLCTKLTKPTSSATLSKVSPSVSHI